MNDAEKQALLKIQVAAEGLPDHPTFAEQKSEGAFAYSDALEVREWDGNLLQCVGSGDRHGVAALGSTALCLPRTLRLNARAAGRDKNARSLAIFVTLAILSGCFLIWTASNTEAYCAPFHHKPHHHHHHHEHGPDHTPERPDQGFHMDPEQQTFLAGATLDPALYATSEPDQPALPQAEQKASSGFIVMVDGKPFDLGEYEESNAQIQLAKNAALEGMTQFQIGRKMLHKHHHHDDDEHEEHDHDKKHKHHDDDHDDDDHDDDDDDDKDNFMMHETFDIREPLEPEEGPVPWPLPEPLDRREREEMCGAAERFQNGATIFFLVVMTGAMVSGYRWRKSLRQKFNIKGSNTKDCLAWTFCTPCAICQETRTLTKNNCSEGVWHGPTQYGVIHAPSQQLFQSAAKA